jgi:FixJ family two-component response regulator
MSQATTSRLVYVVDDDDAFRDSLRWLLESAGYRVALFASAERFLASYRAGDGVCLLLDVRMSGLTGIELQAELNRRADAIPIIFLTGHGDVPMAVEAVKKGAYDFVEKPFANTRLLALIEQVAALDAPARHERAERCSAAARLGTLTEREREVLELVSVGRRNKQIADDLGISVKTVEVHRARAMEKMGAASIAEVVRAMLSSKASR